MEFGNKLNPERSLRKARGVKGERQKVIITHNPSEITQNQTLEKRQNQTLLVNFPTLGSDDMIVPSTANLSFDIDLKSEADKKRTLVKNIGRAIFKKLTVKFEGNEIISIDDFDVFGCYRDFWKTPEQKKHMVRQGVVIDGGCSLNCLKLRTSSGDGDESKTGDKWLAHAYGKRFSIPLDFEMLDCTIPYYQAGLGNRLCYEITFNDFNRTILPSPEGGATPDASYQISNISLRRREGLRERLDTVLQSEVEKGVRHFRG